MAAGVGRLLQRRAVYLEVFVCCAAFIGYAMYLQEVKGLEPCPLCILQRYAYVLVGLLALLAALLPRGLSRFVAGLGILSALGGAGIGVWHVWLQLHPPPVSACGPSLGYLVDNLPLGSALPKIFHGYADCTNIDWTFLGLSIPAWSILCLGGLALLLALGTRRRAG